MHRTAESTKSENKPNIDEDVEIVEFPYTDIEY